MRTGDRVGLESQEGDKRADTSEVRVWRGVSDRWDAKVGRASAHGARGGAKRSQLKTAAAAGKQGHGPAIVTHLLAVDMMGEKTPAIAVEQVRFTRRRDRPETFSLVSSERLITSHQVGASWAQALSASGGTQHQACEETP